MSLHGIYSLSFLELWSLAQGGYSLNILEYIHSKGEVGVEADLSQLKQIGSFKKANRIDSLQRLKLIRHQEEQLSLTQFGLFTIFFLRSIAWLVNLKKDD